MHAAPAVQANATKLLRVLVFTLIISVMNASMFNVALPIIQQEFNLGASHVSWIVTSYIIIYAIGSVTYGKLADRYRLKDLLTYGLLIFAAGSLIGVFATQFWQVIFGRILQSAGASVIPATGMLIPIRYFPPETRGRALGSTTMGLALGAALGPIVAGFVTSFFSWRLLFFLSIFALLTLPYYRRYLDDQKGAAGKTDLLGGALLAGTVAMFLLSITQADWFFLGMGLAFLILFIWRIRTAAEPFLQPQLFRNANYTWGLVIAFFIWGASFGIPILIPMLLAQVNHATPAAIGLVMFPGALAAAAMGKIGGRLADDRGNGFLGSIALTLLFLSFASLSLAVGIAPLWLALFLVLGNIGQAFMQITMSNALSRTLPHQQAGVGMGLFMMGNFIAGAASTTLIGKILDTAGGSLPWNPWAPFQEAGVYSNVFLVMAALVLVIGTLFTWRFGLGAKTPPASQP